MRVEQFCAAYKAQGSDSDECDAIAAQKLAALEAGGAVDVSAGWPEPPPSYAGEMGQAEHDDFLIETAARLALSRMQAAVPDAEPALDPSTPLADLSQMAAPSDDMLFDEEGVPVDVADLRGEEEDISMFKSRLADDLTRLRNLNQMSAQGTYTMTEADRTMLRRLEGRAAEFWFRN